MKNVIRKEDQEENHKVGQCSGRKGLPLGCTVSHRGLKNICLKNSPTSSCSSLTDSTCLAEDRVEDVEAVSTVILGDNKS